MSAQSHDWGPSPHRLFSLQEAWDCIAREVRPLATERVPLSHAEGRILAEPVVCKTDQPPFDRALMDGFAARAADCNAPGTRLTIVGLAAAGNPVAPSVSLGQAVKINTGAPIPSGADTVIRVEDCVISVDGRQVEIRTAAPVSRNIQRCGELRRAQDEVLSPPLRLAAVHLGAAASAGAGRVLVSRTPRVAIVATGDELVLAGEPLRAGQIHESNALMLAALVREFGAEPINLGIVRDDEDELKRAFAEALECDVVIAAGGMSMGTHDLVPKVLESLGIRWLFHGVDMRPGKPAAYGRGPKDRHVFGLPGNPVSGFVCAWLFARMVIRGLCGLPVEPPGRVKANLARDIPPAKDRRPAFLPARVWEDESGTRLVEVVPWGGSADSFGLACANALLMRNDPTSQSDRASSVDAILL